MKEVYFDNASTALPVIAHSMGSFGNPSTTHALGVKAYTALSNARDEISKILGCEKDELVFTSGGTESNNLAIIGYGDANKKKGVNFFALPWAHPSVTQAMKHISDIGVGTNVKLDLQNIKNSIAEGINFISIPQICHETGDKYDIEGITHTIKQLNPKNIIHIDGVQGFCKEKINLKNIDLYSFSGHKIHAPCGIGGLYIKRGVRLLPLLFGGGQENGLRAGTHNTQGVVDLGFAAKKLHESLGSNQKKVAEVKAEMLKLVDELESAYVNSRGESSPYILNMSFLGAKGEVLVNMLSEKGIYASTGAACKVSIKGVQALSLMDFDKERADSAIRFSFSHCNTVGEACLAKKAVIECVSLLRKIRR